MCHGLGGFRCDLRLICLCHPRNKHRGQTVDQLASLFQVIFFLLLLNKKRGKEETL